MLILESLWQPSGKDVLGRVSPIAVRRQSETISTAGDATINTDFEIPAIDEVFVLHGWLLESVPGATFSTVAARLLVMEQASGVLVQTIDANTVAVANPATMEFRPTGQGPHTVIFGGELLRANQVFSGVGAHTARISLFGIIMPRGNWQRG